MRDITYRKLYSGALARSRARNRAPWVRKFGNLCIQEILVLRKSSVRSTYVRPPLHVSRDEILHFKHMRVSAVNRIASRAFRDKNNNNKANSFFRLNFNVYVDVDNGERARARDKKQRRKISLKEKHENFIVAVRNIWKC